MPLFCYMKIFKSVVTNKFSDGNFLRPRLTVFAFAFGKTKTSLRPPQTKKLYKYSFS